MKLVVNELPWAQGETLSLTKAEWDNYCIFVPPKDSGFSDDVVFFVAKDKQGYNALAAKLQQIVNTIKHHNENCDCDLKSETLTFKGVPIEFDNDSPM
jgi:hypothetical protein